MGRLHSHDREELIVVLGGSGTVTLGGDALSVGEGDVIVIPPGTLHRLTATEPLDCLTIEPVGIRFFDADGVEYPVPDVMA